MTTTSNLDSLLIEAAYLAGFEPSDDNLTSDALFTEAQNFLCNTNA